MNLLHLLREIEAEEARRQALLCEAIKALEGLKATLPERIERIVGPILERLERRGRRRGPVYPEAAREAARLKARGWSISRISRKLQLHRKTVARYLETAKEK